MLTCPSDGWRRVPVIELPKYLPRSVIAKMIFKSPPQYKSLHSFTEEMYQAILPCRSHFAADAVCDFQSLSVFSPDILHRALTAVFACNTLVIAEPACKMMHQLRRYMSQQDLVALPCFASCANLQIAYNADVFSDANRALEWLVGTLGVATGVKHLSITDACSDLLVALVDAIEQQFIHATTPASFSAELLCFVGHSAAPAVGTTREQENAVTKERLQIDVENVRKPNGEPAFKTKVTIQRKPTD